MDSVVGVVNDRWIVFNASWNFYEEETSSHQNENFIVLIKLILMFNIVFNKKIPVKYNNLRCWILLHCKRLFRNNLRNCFKFLKQTKKSVVLLLGDFICVEGSDIYEILKHSYIKHNGTIVLFIVL